MTQNDPVAMDVGVIVRAVRKHEVHGQLVCVPLSKTIHMMPEA